MTEKIIMKCQINFFNPKDYWLAGCGEPGGINYPKGIFTNTNRMFYYEVSGYLENGEKFSHNGYVSSNDPETARNLIEYPRKRSGMKKLWCCIFKYSIPDK